MPYLYWKNAAIFSTYANIKIIMKCFELQSSAVVKALLATGLGGL
jgi:hypothetical protein